MTLRLLLVSGSLRDASTSTAALRTVARIGHEGVTCQIYDRLDTLPAFNPDLDSYPLLAEVDALRQNIHLANAILFSTPEYAGALPGSFKNLLDWTIGDDRADSIYEKPVAWINTSPRGAEGAHRELRAVLQYAHASIIDLACVHVPITATMVGADGILQDENSRAVLLQGLIALTAAARTRADLRPRDISESGSTTVTHAQASED